MPQETRTFIVTDKEADRRLDVYLSEQMPDHTRNRIKNIIDDGLVLVNGHGVKPSRKVLKNDNIEVIMLPPEITDVAGQNIPLDILYEDSQIIVVNKAAGMVVHPAPGNPDNTLVNALLHHCTDLSGIGGELRPGIVHRLDKGTSGVLVVAKNDIAHNALSMQFSERTTKKEYRAVVLGRPPTDRGTWNEPIGRHPTQRKKMSIHSKTGRSAVTHFEVLSHRDGVTALAVRIETGRTHQIRVHCNAHDCPVANDELYSGVKRIRQIQNDVIQKLISDLTRPALHAYRISFFHPTTKQSMTLTAPLPMDLILIFNALGVSDE